METATTTSPGRPACASPRVLGVLAAVLAAACGAEVTTVRGSGPVVREARSMAGPGAPPVSLELSGDLDVDVRVGPSLAVFVEGQADLLPYVEARREGDGLRIALPRRTRLSPPPRVEVSLPALRALSLVGAGTVRVVGVEGERLALALEGSGDLDVAGRVGHVEVDMSGSGDVDLDALLADEVLVDKVGSGTARLFASRRLVGDVVGSGDIVHRGGAGEVRVDVLGSARVRAAGER